MNRLKFRIYNKKKKEWMFGYDYPNLGGFSLLGEVVLLGEIQKVQLEELNDLDVMQYTGREDKDKEEIYVGDIFMEQEPGRGYANVYFDNEFSDFALRGINKKRIMNLSEALTIYYENKIVGNIYETN